MVVWAYLTIFEKIYRKIGDLLVDYILVKTPMSGNFVTFLSFIFATGSAISFSFGKYYLGILGLILFEISIILDYADGALARAKEQAGVYGDWLDRTSDLFKDPMVFFGIAYGLFRNTNNFWMIVLGFGAVIVYLVRIAVAHINGFCFKGIHRQDMESNKENEKYKFIRFLQALFIPFLIIATFVSNGLFYYLISYTFFYVLYNGIRVLYSIRHYGKLAKDLK